MKDFFKKIWSFFLDMFKVIDENIEETQPEVEEIPEIIDKIEIEEVPEIKPIVVPETKVEEPKEEVYVMLTNKERQTYLKKLGLYTKTIDNIRGSGQKKAEKQFNIIFLNKTGDTYTEETDKLLRIVYKSYCESPYMTANDWQYIKNFKKSEYKCKCKGKYCNGFPSEISMRLVMANQYIRSYYGVAVTLTSGVRCTTHNKNVDGVTNSKHLKGRASDLTVKGKTASEVRKTVNQLPFISYSYDITKSAVHIDVNL